MTSITSRSNPLVATFRALATTPDSTGTRVLLDGVHLVREARSAGLSFECVAIGTAALDAGGEAAQLAHTLEAVGEPVFAVAEPVLRAMSPVQTPSGIVAIARHTTLQSATLSTSPAALFLVVVDVQDPGNLGALIRVAEAGGVTQVVVCGASAHPFGWRALRGSMGSALRLPLVQYPTTAAALTALHDSGTRVVAAIPRTGPDPDQVAWTGRVAILVGGEGRGLDPAVVAGASEFVTVPMASPVESLNVAVAGAILVYAARRQRR